MLTAQLAFVGACGRPYERATLCTLLLTSKEQTECILCSESCCLTLSYYLTELALTLSEQLAKLDVVAVLEVQLVL